MAIVYDMVSCEFLDQETCSSRSSSLTPYDFTEPRPALQLQMVEQQASIKTNQIPADIALQAYLESC